MSNRQGCNTAKIGRTLEDWKPLRLGDLLSLEYGSGLTESRRVSGKYPVYGSHEIVGCHDQALVKGPGIVVGRKGTVGAVSWAESDFWPIDTTYYVTLKRNDVSLRWLYYKLIDLKLKRLNASTGVPGLNRNDVHAMIVALPSFREQQKMASILSTVDDAIQKTDEIIAKTQQLKKGLMQQLLTKGIGHAKFKRTKIGEMPEDWDCDIVERACDVIMGQSPPGSSYNEKGIGLPLINGPTEFGQVNPSPVQWTSKPTKVCQSADILLCVRGNTAGRTNVADRQYCIGRGVAAIRSKAERTCQGFFKYLFQKLERRILLIAFGAGSTFPNISRDEICNLSIPIPPVTEQIRIANILSEVDESIAKYRTRGEQLEQLKRGLMQVLLTGKVRVKVD